MLARLLLALVAGLGLAAAFEPLGWAWLMPVSLAGGVLAVRGLPPTRSAGVTLVLGVAFIFSVMVWMRAVGTDAWLAMCAVEAAFFVPLGWGWAWAHRSAAWPLWTALWWLGVESLRSVWPFSGMPFGRLAYATADTVWAPSLPWVGMTGLSLAVALTGTVLAWSVVRLRHAPVRVLGVATALTAALALPHALQPDLDRVGEVTVAAVQGDVPGTGTDVVAVHRQVTDNLVELTTELAADVREGRVPELDFVVWPENSTAVDPFDDEEAHAGIEAAVEAVDVPVLVGAMVDAPTEANVLNQGIVWRPVVGPGDRYTKRHPVPYGEYIPFRDQPWMPSTYGQLRLIPRDMMRGTSREPITIAGIDLADAICFDVAYDDVLTDQVARGAQLAAVQTSNAMFVDTGQIDQQFEISRLRALETGRWLVVTAINGVSGVVSPDGTVVASAGARTQRVLVERVGLVEGRTPAVLAGPWTARAVWALLLLHTVLQVFTWRRRVRRTTDDPADERVGP